MQPAMLMDLEDEVFNLTVTVNHALATLLAGYLPVLYHDQAGRVDPIAGVAMTTPGKYLVGLIHRL